MFDVLNEVQFPCCLERLSLGGELFQQDWKRKEDLIADWMKESLHGAPIHRESHCIYEVCVQLRISTGLSGGGFLQPEKAVQAMYHRDTKHLQKTLQRDLWSGSGAWIQERTLILWNKGMPAEAAALYSEFSRGFGLEQGSNK